jgi:GNAT superfamily N-acetyltransferase
MAAPIDLYKRYLLERDNTHLYAEDDCFITYEFCEGYLFIGEFYVVPEKRSAGIGRRISEIVEAIGKKRGYRNVVCTVCTSTNDWQQSLAIIKSGGYKEYKTDGDMIYLVKNI